MKVIIENKVYDTETSTMLMHYSVPNNPGKRKGQTYYLYHYLYENVAEDCGFLYVRKDNYSNGKWKNRDETIIPLTKDELSDLLLGKRVKGYSLLGGYDCTKWSGVKRMWK